MIPSGLIEVLHWLEDLFDRLGLQRSYGGAIAYNYYGPPRLTQDIDVLALISDLKLPSLVEEFALAGCRHGDIEPKPVTLKAVLEGLRSKAHLSTFWCFGVRVELFAPWHPFHHNVLARSPERDFEGRKIRIHKAEDIIIFKKIFDRPKDITDINAMLLAQKGNLDVAQILKDAEDLLAEKSLSELRQLIGS